MWNAAKEAKTDITLYRKYLSKYPQGKYVGDVENRIEELVWNAAEETKTDITLYRKYLSKYPMGKYATQAKDYDDWAKTEKAGTVEAIKLYLKEWPKGRFVKKARNKLFIPDKILQHDLTALAKELLAFFKNKRFKNKALLTKIMGDSENISVNNTMRSGMMRNEDRTYQNTSVLGTVDITVSISQNYMTVSGTGVGKGVNPILDYDPSLKVVAHCRTLYGQYNMTIGHL